jgi:outer membrane protein TolC
MTPATQHALPPCGRGHGRPLRLLVAALALPLLLGGCAGFSPDGGMTAVQEIAGTPLNKDVAALRNGGDALAARVVIDGLLKKPLTADTAVQIALLNNRDLQAAYSALGISEAARVQASLPPNPTFSLSHVSGSGAFEIERQIAFNILSLATLPARAQIAADRFHQAQLKAAEETLRVAAETRSAFYRAVAAHELAGYLAQSQSAAEAAVQLSKRLGESGAATKLDQARNQVFYAELAAQLGTARQRANSERERLVRAIGLWGGDLAFKLPGALPALPKRPRVAAMVETEAVGRRVDLQRARIEVEALAKSYGLTNATRFITLLELSGMSKSVREPGGDRANEFGGGVEFQVPLFDFGEVRVREVEAAYMQAVNRLAAKAVTVRSEAREAYQSYRAAYDVARQYRGEVLPLRKIISDESLLRYNAMQIDVFALLSEARQRIASTVAAIEAQRDFWIADANLGSAVIGGGAPMETEASAIAPAVEPAGQH